MITKLRHACITPDSRQQCPKCGFIEGGSVPITLVAGFYTELGLSVVYAGKETWQWGKQEIIIGVLKLAVPGQEVTGPYLEIVEGNWGAHIAFEVDEFPEDVKLSNPVRLDKHNEDVEVAFCMDPAGNMVELVKKGGVV